MSKPTPIDKWIEEKWPENEFDPVVDFDDYILNSTSRQAARETARYILEELGVLECLEFYKEQGEFKPYRVPSTNYVVDDYGKLAIQTLKKLKGEKDAD